VALAGLGWLPDTILTRSVIIRMRRRHAGESVEPFRNRIRCAVVTLVTAAKEAEPIVSLSMRDHARFRSRKTGKPFDFIHLTGFARDPVRWHLARERRRWRGRESRPSTRQP
jgi:hypothetical protein